MLKSKHGWSGKYRWGKDNCWSNGGWDFNALHSASWGVTVRGLSLADGVAFVKVSGASLAGYVGVEGTSTPWKLVLRDSVGVATVGYIGAVDAAETLGGELVTNGTFDANINGWTEFPLYPFTTHVWQAGKLHAVSLITDDGIGTGPHFSTTAGKLYKVTFDLVVNSGTGPVCGIGETNVAWNFAFNNTSNMVSGSYTFYFTSIITSSVQEFIYWNQNLAGDYTLDNISIQEVTHVGATGAHIVSAKDGSTRNWASIGTGFNYNDTKYRAEIRRA